MISERLAELGLKLPPTPQPLGGYVPWVRSGCLLFVAGMLPIDGNQVIVRGKVGSTLSAQDGVRAALLCALNSLAAALDAVNGDEERLLRVVMLTGYVNAVDGFPEAPRILNGASDLFVSLLGERGKHARTAVNVGGLPKNAAVEVQVVYEISD